MREPSENGAIHSDIPGQVEISRVNERPAIFRSTAQEVLFVFTATMSVAMASFLQGSTLVVSSFIQRDLSMTTAELTWMTASSS